MQDLLVGLTTLLLFFVAKFCMLYLFVNLD